MNKNNDYDRGYAEGELCCKQGFCYDCIADGKADTEWAKGYIAGWDAAKAAGLHGTVEKIRDKRLQPWSNDYL